MVSRFYSKKFTNKHGFEKRGGHFTVFSLERILTNRAYLGLREIGKKAGKVEITKASGKAIIDPILFDKVQGRLKLNKNKYKPDEWKTYSFPLTELVICGECGKHLGGKSGHGRNGKYYYYGHPRQLHSDGISHLKRCRMENVRAPRIEEIILKSIKQIANDPKIIEKWIEIYSKSKAHNLPALEGRIASAQTEIRTQEKRMENLTSRLADLPKEVPADSIYEQMQKIKEKREAFNLSLQNLLSEKRCVVSRSIDQTQLMNRITRTMAVLDKTPSELRRGVYSNLIQYAELHPTKIRLGLLAPAGSAALHSQFSDFNRMGSCNVTSGAGRGT